MEPIPKSGYFYPNKAARIMLESLERVMGKNGLKVILHQAHLPDLLEHYPPDDMEQQFDFADFSATSLALEEMYGKRGGYGLALRAGREIFAGAFQNYGALAGVGNPAFKALPLRTRLKIGLPVFAKVLSQISDQQGAIEDIPDEFTYTVHRCPHCWGRSGMDEPVCYMGAGLLQEAMKWLSGGEEFSVSETMCKAKGEPACEYTIRKTPVGQ